MKLLFTGASGFLGHNIYPLLKKRYEISTIGLTSKDDYCIDIAKKIPDLRTTYDIVFHAAGKAHSIPRTENDKKDFFNVNLQGTKNLCAALENSGIPKAFIFVSTVAVYGCDSGVDITESHPLNGTSPYAESKKLAEYYLQEWSSMNGVTLGIIRPSLIAGPNPPGNLGTMIKGIYDGKYLSISKGKARKSVLMVQDIANLLPLLAEKGGIYNVCDTYQPTFRELELVISRQLSKPLPFSIPYCLAKLLALAGDCLGNKVPINSMTLRKMTESLTFSNEKARHELNWKPLSVLDNFIIKNIK